ncbi:MAG: Rrf2 family transcriptional regulator [Gammaproteobacteria bacterium]|nr:Rrf2 family transcriptional regulator [Gammaproteobacteria bacterium]
MQLTKHTDLSLRVLIYLALKPGQLGVISDIARHYGASKNHLVKVVHRLATLGYINSFQGRGGGIRLSKQADNIIVGKVVRDMENTMDVIDCAGTGCPLLPACHLKPILNAATSAFLEVLDNYSIADLITNKEQLLKLVG